MSGDVAIVLAAGASSRLGEPKQLVQFRGRPLVAHAVEQARRSGVDRVVVVTGAHAPAVEAAIEHAPEVTIVRNPTWAAGQGTSVATGVRTASTDGAMAPDALLITTCDQPLVDPEHLRALLDAVRHGPTAIAATAYDGGDGGIPACFGPAMFEALIALDGPVGARALIRRAQTTSSVTLLDAPAARHDIDTPDDLAALGRAHTVATDRTDG